ncbi:MAG: nuclear transport factor 2 family protein, partial [Armatimonadetes bacterium]|nr:nuclear transport factor 2 family protein [Armatimonadota bacterium]
NGKTMDFDTMVAQMKAGMGPGVKMSYSTTKILSVTEKGKTGTAKMTSSMGMSEVGPDKKTHKMTFVGTSSSTFRLEGGKWKMASMSWGKQTMTMDGKPFDPSKMAAPSKSK